MMLVSMSDPGLVILPTHRLVSGSAGTPRPSSLRALAGTAFRGGNGRHRPAGGTRRLGADRGGRQQELLGFGTVADGVWQTGAIPIAGG